MRLFIAIHLPEEVLGPLVEQAARLRSRLPPARWVPAANLHLTLRFLGETGEDLIPALGSVLADCFGQRSPFRLQLSGGGCFPPRRPARVAWVGFEPCQELLELQAALSGALEARLGIADEGRRFHPHLTLARPRRPWPRGAVESWQKVFDGRRGPAFGVSQGHLMRSHLRPGGARHESLAEYRLAAGSFSGV